MFLGLKGLDHGIGIIKFNFNPLSLNAISKSDVKINKSWEESIIILLNGRVNWRQN